MKTKSLQLKKVMSAALFFLLLSVTGMTKAASLTSVPIEDTIRAKTVGVIPYSEDFTTIEEVVERYYSITSFRMIDTATVAVLTGASDMILVYSFEENQILRKIQLPIFARAFEYDNGLFHVIGDRTYLTIDAEGMIRERKDFQQPQLPNDEIFIITDLKVIDGQPIIHECNANTYSITSDGLQKIDTFYCERGFKIHPKYIDENSFVIYNETPSRSGRISVSMESLGLEGKLACLDEISVNEDFIAINLQTSHNPTGRFVKSYLLVVNSNGELINLVEVPIDFLSCIHKPFSYKDNAWYYAFSGQEGISIFKINTNTNSVACPDSYELYDEGIDYSYYEPENGTSGEDINSPTRGNWRTITQAWENAERFRDMEWTPVSGNVSAPCTPITSSLYITTPVSNYNTQTGVPYKYGGFTDWDYYKDLASSGKYTGNRHCYYGHDNCYHNPYQDGSDTYVIGVDCSGFLSRCWELSSHIGTSSIPSSTYTQSLGAVTSHFNDGTLRTGDALNQLGNSNCTNVPRHVMMYAYHSSTNAIIVFESSSDGWKVNSNSRSLSYFQGQYYCQLSGGGSTYYYRNYTIQRSNIMKDITLRLNSAITMRQNGSIVTNVTQGEPLTVTYSVKNFGSEVWEGDVYLYIEQSDGDLISVKSDHTTLVPNDYQSFTFSNNGVISPVGTTKFYVKVKNYNAGGYDRPYDVGNGEYENPLEFQIVEGSGGGGGTSCNSCPDYDETWSITGNGTWTTKSSSIGTNGCRIYRVQLSPSYTYTFKTCDEGTATFDTRLHLYNASCNLVTEDDDGCTGTSSLIEYTYTGNNAAYFYLKIDGYGSSSGSYTIAAKREGDDTPSCSDCPDYDETWSISGDGTWSTKSSSIGANGCRIYRVYLSSSYTYTFQTCGEGDASFDTRLYLYDASCNEVAYNDDSDDCSDNLSSIEYTNTGNAGYYYLKIDGWNGAGGTFTIAGKRESGTSPCSDCPVYDETWSISGDGVWTTKSSSIGSGGCRIYRVQLSSSYTYTFQTGCDHGTADFDTQLYLYDASCDEVAYNDDGCSYHLSSIEYTNTGSTAYFYLKIDGYDESEYGSYTIAAKRESPTATYVINVSASPSAGGTVGGAGTYDEGSTCTLTATPNTGYTFTKWTKNGSQVSTSANYPFTVTENASYVAVFTQNSYSISASANPSNGGTVSGGGNYNHGSNCTLTATANTGYSFTNWTKNGQQVSTSATYSFTVTETGNYVANFSQNSYTISASANPSNGGTVSGGGTYNYGANCTLTATANSGYTFSNWTENSTVVSSSTNYSFTVTGSRNLVANFTANPVYYTITVTANPSNGGTVTGGGSYQQGNSCTLTATANSGYTFTNWTKNGQQVSTSATYSFTVTEGANYVANFEVVSSGYYWTVNTNQYPNTMLAIGIIRIDGEEQATNTLELGAFCNNECRGREKLTYYGSLDRYLLFMTFYGNDGDVLNLRLYDHAIGQELDLSCTTTITFATNSTVGTATNPYVFDFSSTTTQVTSMPAGWTWWSTYIEQSGNNGLDQMEESLGTNGLFIKSQANGFVTNVGTFWAGQLQSINNESTYLIQTSSACEMLMTGSVAQASAHPITLPTGWTWLGFPSGTAMSVSTALSGLTPAANDVLKSHESFVIYTPGIGWLGGLNTLTPGMGLMFESHNSNTVTLTYPDVTRMETLMENRTARGNHWDPVPSAYPDNMNVVAVVELDGEELALRQVQESTERYELSVFANGECRGSARLMYVESLQRHIAFLTVYGDGDAELDFGLYDAELDEEYWDTNETLSFASNAIVGSAETPMTVRFRSLTGEEEWASAIHLFPNPVNRGEVFRLGLSEVSAPMTVEIVNALGVVVESLHATSSQTLKAPSVAGVYTLRITVKGQGICFRRLVVR